MRVIYADRVTTRAASLSLFIAFLASSACSTETEKADTEKTDTGKTDTKKTDSKDESITKTVDHANVGTACIAAGADGAQAVTVDFGLCMSSSCDELDSASCSVEQTGSDLKVSSKATVTSTGGPNTVCTTDCRTISATCTGPTLAAGTYTLVYGDTRQAVTLPVVDKTCTKDPRFD